MNFKIIFFSAILFSVFSFTLNRQAMAQHHEFGAGIGVLNYAGDLGRGYKINNIRPGGELYYRYNFNPIVSFRGFGRFGGLAGSDARPIDPAADRRNASFEIFVVELGADFEYNFLDIKTAKSHNNWTPFLFFGVGMFQILGDDPVNGEGKYSGLQPMIPFGTGVKGELTPYLNFEFQIGARKLFTDWIDDVSSGDPSLKNYQYGNKHDMDWYSYIGLSISYTIYTVDCPYDFYHSRTGK